MHILLIHQAFAGPNDPGGTRHFELSSKLAAQGHRVTILASPVNYMTGSGGSGDTPMPAGVSVVKCPVYKPMHKSFLHRLLAYFSFSASSFAKALVQPDIDLVWATSPPLFQAVTALAVARLRGLPLLFEVRDLWPDFAVELGVLKNPLLIRLSRGLEWFLYRSADRILVNSPGFIPHIRKAGIEPEFIDFVANGADISEFHPERDGSAFRREFGLGDKFVVLYAGALGMANDIETVLMAAARLADEPEILFAFVGDGKDRPRLEARARELGLRNVRFLAAQPKSRMPEVVAASDACLAILKDIPLFRTTFPNKVFDYMAAGRPILLAIAGVIRETLAEEEAALSVTPGNADDLAAQVRKLKDDAELRRSLARNARKLAETRFDRRVQFHSLFRAMSLAARPPAALEYPGKRLLDIAASLALLVLLVPFLALVALLIRVSMGSPVLFTQVRAGLKGRPFRLIKFRTMALETEGTMPASDAARLTAVGRFLRAASLDELPELFNVLKGEMSLVGPRPLFYRYVERYDDRQRTRLDCRPGITGWAQINGRNSLEWEQKFEFDLWYRAHQSPALDLKILGLTLWKAMLRDGINAPGQATAREFMGAK